MQSILSLSRTNKLILAGFAFLAVLTLGTGRAHAATLNVTGGCTLPIAIASVNAGSNQSGCTAVISPNNYGTSDTITIPSGTISLTTDLPTITESVLIEGAGMSQTTISGDNGQYSVFKTNNSTIFELTDMKVTAFEACAIETSDTNVTLRNIDIDGNNVVGSICGVKVLSGGSSIAYDSSNLYIHDFNESGGDYIEGIRVSTSGGGTVDVDLRNTTLSSLHALTGGINGIFLAPGFEGIGGGSVSAVITNTTVDDLTSTGITAPFANIAGANGADASTTTVVNNITITGTRGVPGSGQLTGIDTAAFYAVGFAFGPTDTSNVNVSISNSLMADNMSSSTYSNCSQGNLSSVFNGTGTVNTSFTSLGHNISDDDTCGFTQIGDQQNVNNIISTLGTLQDNGGAVPTRALLAGSPAIAAGGSVLGVTTDARGIARPNTCPSVGAFQFEGAVCAATTTNANAGGAAAAPNTGIGSVSILVAAVTTLFGILALGYAFATKSS